MWLQVLLPCSSPRSMGESQLCHLESPLPCLFKPQCLQTCSSHTFSLILSCLISGYNYFCTVTLFPFLNMLSKRHCHHPWWAPALPSAASVLELADVGSVRHRKPSCSFLQKPPLQCFPSSLISKTFLCSSGQEGLGSLSRILHSWWSVSSVQCLLRTIWMTF